MKKLLSRAVWVVLLAATPLWAATADVKVGPSEQPGVVHVTGRLFVSASPGAAWRVLTDYDHIADFVSSMRRSRSWRGPQGLRVEQDAVGRFGIFRSALHVVLAIKETPMVRIDFEDTDDCHCFKVYRGSWVIEPSSGGAVVRYTLDAEPSGAAARLVAGHAMRKNVERLLEEVGAEIERRGALRASGGQAGLTRRG